MRDFKQSVTKNVSGLSYSVQGVQRGVGGAVTGISRIFSRNGILVGAILTRLSAVSMGVHSAVRDASLLEANVIQIDNLMGESADGFETWAREVGASFGYSERTAMSAGAIYANLMSTFSTSAEETKNKTEALMKATAIISSRTGRTMEDTLERIHSGLLGNTEAIEDLGMST